MTERTYSILLIEDEPVDAKLIEKALQRKAPDRIQLTHISCSADAIPAFRKRLELKSTLKLLS